MGKITGSAARFALLSLAGVIIAAYSVAVINSSRSEAYVETRVGIPGEWGNPSCPGQALAAWEHINPHAGNHSACGF